MADKKKYIGENALSYFWLKIKGFLNNKVDKVEGKGLSTNDLTDELKQKILDAGSSSFTGDYGDLTSKPSINGKTINGIMTLDDIGAVVGTDRITYEDNGSHYILETTYPDFVIGTDIIESGRAYETFREK